MTKVLPTTLTTMITETPGGPPPPGAPPAHAPYGHAPPAGAPVGPGVRTSGKAIAALILGIFGFCIAWIPVVNFLAFITAILAIVFGILAKKEIETSGGMVTGNGMAITGIVLGALQLLFVLAVLAFLGALWSEIQRDLEEAGQMALAML